MYIKTYLLTVISILLFGNAQAVVVTFEDMPAIDINDVCQSGSDPCDVAVTPQGFVFEATNSLDPFSVLAVQAGGPTGNYLGAGYAFPSGGSADLIITHQSGSAFSLQSMDAVLDDVLYQEWQDGVFSSISPLQIVGYDESGTQIAAMAIEAPGLGFSSTWTSINFDSSWNAVHKIVVEHQQLNSNFGSESRGIRIDNFSATVVPVPAAVWLFGSALAGLGWMRRKQTV